MFTGRSIRIQHIGQYSMTFTNSASADAVGNMSAAPSRNRPACQHNPTFIKSADHRIVCIGRSFLFTTHRPVSITLANSASTDDVINASATPSLSRPVCQHNTAFIESAESRIICTSPFIMLTVHQLVGGNSASSHFHCK